LQEEEQLKSIVQKDLANGIDGMTELACLAKAGEKATQYPLQDATSNVLRIIEQTTGDSMLANIAYITECGRFLYNILQWVENADIVKSHFDRLWNSIKRVLTSLVGDSTEIEECMFTFASLLMRLRAVDNISLGALVAIEMGNTSLSVALSRVMDNPLWCAKGAMWKSTLENIITQINKSD
jgi:hypothetical protein